MFQIFFANAQNIFFSIIQRTYIFNYSSLNYVVVAKLQFFIFMGCSIATLRGHQEQEHSCYGTVSRIRRVFVYWILSWVGFPIFYKAWWRRCRR